MIFRIFKALYKRIINLLYRWKLDYMGPHSFIIKPLKIKGKGIRIGHHTIINDLTWLECMPLTGDHKAELIIGDYCAIGHFNEIYSTKSIVIENHVLTADRVYISDNLHGYEDPDIPILNQPIKQVGTVRIGEGTWIGVGVAIIGVKIGKHCVIGANAVVNRDIPDYCVAVGIPARIVKRYNFETKSWERTTPDGEFLK